MQTLIYFFNIILTNYSYLYIFIIYITMDKSLLLILSGLSLFLFSLDQIKKHLNTLFISKLHNFISKSVNTKLKSFLVGCIASAAIQSSSGITAIAISLLSSNYIKKKDCLGIIIGANLGTCLTTFIIAINYK